MPLSFLADKNVVPLGTPPKINNLQIMEFFSDAFSLSIWVYSQVPAVNLLGCKPEN